MKSGSINVQIVLGNSNLGLAIPMTTQRGERQGGVVQRLGKKAEVGERGKEGRSTVGPEVTSGKEASNMGEKGTGGIVSQTARAMLLRAMIATARL
jgi:hypothetical protein